MRELVHPPLFRAKGENHGRWLSASGETFLEMQIAMRATQEDTASEVKLRSKGEWGIAWAASIETVA